MFNLREIKVKIFEVKNILQISTVRDDLEEELRQQLKRQLAAHTDHLQEQLHCQARELDRKHQVTLEEQILVERSKLQNTLASSLNRLQDVENILSGEYFFLFVENSIIVIFPFFSSRST